MAGKDPPSGRGRAELLRRMIEDNGRVDDEFFAPDAVSFRPWDLVAQTLAGVEHPSDPPRAADTEAEFGLGRMFSNAKLSVEAAEEIGDEVRIRWRLCAVHSEACFGIEPTGDEINATGRTTYRFNDDKIVEVSGAADCSSLGMMCSQIVEAMARARTLQPVCLVGAEGKTPPAR